MSSIRSFSLASLIVAGLLPLLLRADIRSANKTLEEKGLTRQGTKYILAGEAELRKRLLQTRRLRTNLNKAEKNIAPYYQRDRIIAGQLQQAFAQRRQLNLALASDLPRGQHNRAVAQVNELSDRIRLLQSERTRNTEQGQAVEAEVGRMREAFLQAVVNLRNHVDATTQRYASLGQDGEVRAALAELSAETKRKRSLGPSAGFARNLKAFEKIESTILTDSIELRRRNNVFWVDTVINGEVSKALVLDTGASLVSVPAKLAKELGLKPTDAHPNLRLTLADGRVIRAKQMVLQSVRIGKFTVQNVECAVLPETLTDAPPLLGGTFLQHFTYRIQPEIGKLTLSKIERESDKRKSKRKQRGKQAAP